MKGGFSSLTRAAAAKEEDKDKDEEGGVTMKKNKNTTNNNTHQLITFFKFTALSNAEDEVDAHREFIETNKKNNVIRLREQSDVLFFSLLLQKISIVSSERSAFKLLLVEEF